MKTLLFASAFFCSLVSWGEYVPAYMVNYRADSGVAANEGKVLVSCDFNTKSLNQQPFMLYYGVNGSSEERSIEKDHQLSLAVQPGKYVFQYYVDGFEEITTDSVEVKPGMLTIIDLYFRSARIPVTAEKPVIYLYPETDRSVTTTVYPNGSFLFTYPVYENDWTGIAHPDGSISIGDKTYPYLFWEAEMELSEEMVTNETGFLIPGSEVVAFLEEQLTYIGLNDRERADLITYWGPRMVAHEQVAIQFAWDDACDHFATLKIDPQPDQLHRLYLLWAPCADCYSSLTPQALPVFDRTGFNVLEWGGIEVPFTLFKNPSEQ